MRSELNQLAAEIGCEVLHTELQGGRLLVVVDHPEGVTLEHCSTVSKQLSAILDREDFGDRKYTLEVSSPGLDRQLYRPSDYIRFAGRTVRVTFRLGSERRKQTVVGTLEIDPEASSSATPADVPRTISIVDPAGARHRIHLEDIQVARLEIEL